MDLDGLKQSGADWLERFKPYIEDGKTIVVAPHKVWGPETNDLVLQLRKRKIDKIIIGGMLAAISPRFCGTEPMTNGKSPSIYPSR